MDRFFRPYSRQIHAAVGLAVTLTHTNSRCACVMNSRTDSVRKLSVGTVNWPAAQLSGRWLVRKVRQFWLGGRADPRRRYR